MLLEVGARAGGSRQQDSDLQRVGGRHAPPGAGVVQLGEMESRSPQKALGPGGPSSASLHSPRPKADAMSPGLPKPIHSSVQGCHPKAVPTRDDGWDLPTHYTASTSQMRKLRPASQLAGLRAVPTALGEEADTPQDFGDAGLVFRLCPKQKLLGLFCPLTNRVRLCPQMCAAAEQRHEVWTGLRHEGAAQWPC